MATTKKQTPYDGKTLKELKSILQKHQAKQENNVTYAEMTSAREKGLANSFVDAVVAELVRMMKRSPDLPNQFSKYSMVRAAKKSKAKAPEKKSNIPKKKKRRPKKDQEEKDDQPDQEDPPEPEPEPDPEPEQEQEKPKKTYEIDGIPTRISGSATQALVRVASYMLWDISEVEEEPEDLKEESLRAFLNKSVREFDGPNITCLITHAANAYKSDADMFSDILSPVFKKHIDQRKLASFAVGQLSKCLTLMATQVAHMQWYGTRQTINHQDIFVALRNLEIGAEDLNTLSGGMMKKLNDDVELSIEITKYEGYVKKKMREDGVKKSPAAAEDGDDDEEGDGKKSKEKPKKKEKKKEKEKPKKAAKGKKEKPKKAAKNDSATPSDSESED